MPLKDGWGRPFQLGANQPLGSAMPAQSYAITSHGKDGVAETNPAGGGVSSYDCDIIYSNGSFLQYPASIQQQ